MIATSSLSKATKMIEYLSLHFDLTRARATSIIAATPLDYDDAFDTDYDAVAIFDEDAIPAVERFDAGVISNLIHCHCIHL